LGGLCILSTVARTIAIGTTANIAQVGLWTSLEQMTGLVVVCIPALKALVAEHRSRDGSRNIVESGNAGTRLSKLDRLGRQSGLARSNALDDDDEMGISWIRMESPGPESDGERKSISQVSIGTDHGVTSLSPAPNPATQEWRSSSCTFDEKLENAGDTKKMKLQMNDDGDSDHEPGKKFMVVEA